MHRDKKLGLALALLVIGFAGAFCYRNDQFGLLSDASPQKEPSTTNENVAAASPKPRTSRSRRDHEEEEFTSQQQTVASSTSSYRRDDETSSRQIAPLDESASTQNVSDGYSSQNEFNPNPFGDLDEFDNFLNDSSLSQNSTDKQTRTNQTGSANSLVSQTEKTSSRQYHSPEHNQLWEEESTTSSDIVADSGRTQQFNRDNLNSQNSHQSHQNENLEAPQERIALKQTERSSRNTDSQFTSFPDLLSENEVNPSDKSLSNAEPSPFDNSAEFESNEIETNRFVSSNSPRARLNQSIETDEGTYNFLEEENDPFAESPKSSLPKQEVTDYRQAESAQRKTYPETYPTTSQTKLNRPEFTNSTPSEVHSESRDMASFSGSNTLPAPNTKSAPELQAGQMLIHQVRKNETLSGLASRYLGSSRKYMQIYNANRDILSNPNDIRIGMKLRIPKRNQASSNQAWNVSTPQAESAKLYQNPKYSTSQYKAKPKVESLPTATPQPGSDYGSPVNKFQPVSRSPFQH